MKVTFSGDGYEARFGKRQRQTSPNYETGIVTEERLTLPKKDMYV